MQFRYNDQAKIAWVAAIIDGEGHIGLSQGRPRISVEMTDEDLIDRLLLLSGTGKKYGPYSGTNKDCWQWIVNKSSDAIALCYTIYPIMSIRRQNKIREVITRWLETDNTSQIVHGTLAGYHKEKRCSYEPCEPCTLAYKKYNKEYYLKKKREMV